jgi:hypothetical protein
MADVDLSHEGWSEKKSWIKLENSEIFIIRNIYDTR